MTCDHCGLGWTRRLGDVTADGSGRRLHAACRRLVDSNPLITRNKERP